MALSLILRVGETSAQDVSLVSGGVFLSGYAMGSPDVSQQALQNLGDGNGLSIPAWSNVTESIDLHISAATAALVAAKVKSIEKLLDLARQGTTGWLDDRLYLLAQFDQDTEAWRSQILAAKLQLSAPTEQIWRNFVDATIILTRRYYWETETIHAIAMTSGPTTTPTTGYVTVYNADDTHATNRNWFQIDSAQVEGSIPTPLRLYVKNNSGAARSIRALYIGNYVWTAPTTADPIFRAEDAAGSDTSWLTTLETETYFWSLSGDNLTDSFKRQFGRILAIFSSLPEPTTLLRAAVQYRFPSPVVDIALGEQVLAGTNVVVDLGGLPIPPGGHWEDIGDLLYLTLKAKAATAAGDGLTVDWIQVMPSGAGRYRVLKAIINSMSMDDGDIVIDDGVNGGVYALSGSNAAPLYRPFFDPIYAWPGKTQRLRVLIQGNTSMEVGLQWQVKCETRFRRLTV